MPATAKKLSERAGTPESRGRRKREPPNTASLKRLPEFFGTKARLTSQDGGGSQASAGPAHSIGGKGQSAARRLTQLSQPSAAASDTRLEGDSEYLADSPQVQTDSQPATPSSRSPVKHKPRLSGSPTKQQQQVSAEGQDEPWDMQEEGDTEEIQAGGSFPQLALQNMFKSLRMSIRQDFTHILDQKLGELGDRVHIVEERISEHTVAFNSLLDSHQALYSEVQEMRIKMADMEDRSRRNNLKLRGVCEDVAPHDLAQYLAQMIHAACPDILASELVIDRAHRLPKPKHLPASLPRDVIARVHFYHVKDKFLYAMRSNPNLPQPFTNVAVYADLSQATLRARKQLVTLTKLLRGGQVKYKWGFPPKLLVTHEGKLHVISSLEEGLILMRRWGWLPPNESQHFTPPPGLNPFSLDWSKA